MEYELILLAAGFSRRFGANKLLYPLEGTPMVRRASELLLELRDRRKDIGTIAAVTRYPEVEEIFRQQGLRAVFNPCSRRGLSSSLRAGLRAVLEEKREGRPGEKAFCFFMGDQPYLKADTVSKLLDQYPFSGKGIARLCWKGRPGHPAVFAERYLPELLALTGDQGGRRIIQRHPEDVWEMEAEDGRELLDVDRPWNVCGTEIPQEQERE